MGSLATMVKLRAALRRRAVAGDLAAAGAADRRHRTATSARSTCRCSSPRCTRSGAAWEEAEISIAQEHLATATTQSLMASPTPAASTLRAPRAAQQPRARRLRRERVALAQRADGRRLPRGRRLGRPVRRRALAGPRRLAELAAASASTVVALSASFASACRRSQCRGRALPALDATLPRSPSAARPSAAMPPPRLATGADLYAPNAAALVHDPGMPRSGSASRSRTGSGVRTPSSRGAAARRRTADRARRPRRSSGSRGARRLRARDLIEPSQHAALARRLVAADDSSARPGAFAFPARGPAPRDRPAPVDGGRRRRPAGGRRAA